jgi:hypothetical protein
MTAWRVHWRSPCKPSAIIDVQPNRASPIWLTSIDLFCALSPAELAAAVGDSCRLVPLGHRELRGVRELREIYSSELG